MNQFKHIKIGQICQVGDGAHASIKRVEKGVMYLTSKNFTQDGINLNKTDYISEIDYSKHFKTESKAVKKPRHGDVLFSIIGSIGATYLVKKNDYFGLSSSVSIIRADESELLPKYLYYWIKTDHFQKSINAIKSGVAQSFLSLDMIRSLPLVFPIDLPTQKRIAAILSAYDDLIENNSKRIKLLEEIAQRTYEEWFVKFRVKGEQLPIDEATGLPSGWKYKPFHDLIDFKEGPGLRNTQYRDSGIPFLNIRVIKDDEVDLSKVQFLDPIEVENKYQHFLLNENDHVISTSGTLGRVVTIRKRHLPICLNTSLIRMRPLDNNFGKWLIKHTITNPKFKETMDSYANGSAQLNFGPIHLKQIKLIAPSQTIALEYEKIAEPIEELIKKLKDQNIFLKQSRDILLPRLMSGTINVES
jgi:type I restriction enzyme S subunit